jgi:predicted AlkP superfamily phosphohydrolase/phosphomutase
MTDNTNVLLIGIDAATFDIITPWLRAGKLPTIGQLVSTGAGGELLSILPITPAAWTSAATGLNVGKHGLCDFIKRVPNSYKLRLVNRRDRTCESLWSLASRYGKKVIVINYPMTYPPERVNGLMIADISPPGADAEFTYPRSLKRELIAQFGSYKFSVDLSPEADGMKYIDAVFELTEFRGAVAKYLMETYDWNLFIVVFMGIDMIIHAFWKYIDPGWPHSKEEPNAGMYSEAILQIHQKLDKIISELWHVGNRIHGNELTIVLVSDHGTGPLYKHVYLNNWLINKGFMQLQNVRRYQRKRRGTKVYRLIPQRLQNFLTKYRLCFSGLTKLTGLKHEVYDEHEKNLASLSLVDWTKTIAYSYGNLSSITINLRGREPKGIVDAGEELMAVKSQLIRELKKLRDPETNKRIVDYVVEKEKVFHGSYMDELPDLFIVMDDFKYMGKGVTPIYPVQTSALVETPSLSGTHRPNGIIIVHGPNINEGVKLHDAEIIDVTPTVLYLLGIPLPHDMDGKVLTTAIADSYLAARPIRYSVESMLRRGKMHKIRDDELQITFTKAEEDEIKSRLRKLGYVA